MSDKPIHTLPGHLLVRLIDSNDETPGRDEARERLTACGDALIGIANPKAFREAISEILNCGLDGSRLSYALRHLRDLQAGRPGTLTFIPTATLDQIEKALKALAPDNAFTGEELSGGPSCIGCGRDRFNVELDKGAHGPGCAWVAGRAALDAIKSLKG